MEFGYIAGPGDSVSGHGEVVGFGIENVESIGEVGECDDAAGVGGVGGHEGGASDRGGDVEVGVGDDGGADGLYLCGVVGTSDTVMLLPASCL